MTANVGSLGEALDEKGWTPSDRRIMVNLSPSAPPLRRSLRNRRAIFQRTDIDPLRKAGWPLQNNATLRTLKGAVLIVECKCCGIYGELDRKDVVKKHRASITLSGLRRSLISACDKMCAEDGDRCQARVASLATWNRR